MTAIARITILHMRTVAPYRTQGLLVFGLLMLILGHTLITSYRRWQCCWPR